MNPTSQTMSSSISTCKTQAQKAAIFLLIMLVTTTTTNKCEAASTISTSTATTASTTLKTTFRLPTRTSDWPLPGLDLTSLTSTTRATSLYVAAHANTPASASPSPTALYTTTSTITAGREDISEASSTSTFEATTERLATATIDDFTLAAIAQVAPSDADADADVVPVVVAAVGVMPAETEAEARLDSEALVKRSWDERERRDEIDRAWTRTRRRREGERSLLGDRLFEALVRGAGVRMGFGPGVLL